MNISWIPAADRHSQRSSQWSQPTGARSSVRTRLGFLLDLVVSTQAAVTCLLHSTSIRAAIMSCTCCNLTGVPHDYSTAPPTPHEYRQKYRHITEFPEEYLRDLQSRLIPSTELFKSLHENHEDLAQLHEFLFGWMGDANSGSEFAEHRRCLEIFVEKGLADCFTNLVCSDEFWLYTTDLKSAGIPHKWLQVSTLRSLSDRVST